MSDSLSERELEVLESLDGWRKQWCTPMFVGGHNGSHHSKTLKKLVLKGLVMTRHHSGDTPRTGPDAWNEGQRHHRPRKYRISEAGVASLYAVRTESVL